MTARTSIMAVVCSTLLLESSITATSAEKYLNASVGERGNVVVVTASGQRLIPRIDAEQVDSDSAVTAPNRRSVGWLALYPVAFASYPLPLKLVILSDGRVHVLAGERHQLISKWMFQDGGKRVAFREETAHGGTAAHYELWNVATAKRIVSYTPEIDIDGREVGRRRQPNWVRILDSAQRKH